MAEPLEETTGHAADAPHFAKEAPITQACFSKENGKLPAPERPAELGTKQKEDSPVAHSAVHAIPSEDADEVEKADAEGVAKSATAPDAPKAEGEALKFEEQEVETAGTVEDEESPVTTEEALREETGRSVGEKDPDVRATTGSADIADSGPGYREAEEETTKPFETGQTDEPKTVFVEGGNSETGEPEREVGETEAHENPSGGREEVEAVFKSGEHQDAVASADTEEPHAAEVVSKQEDVAADPEEWTPSEEKGGEEARQAEQQDVPAPPAAPGEQEEPAAGLEDKNKPKSFWGVVLKHVEPYAKPFLGAQPEGEDSISTPSSDVQESNAVDKSPEEAHEKEALAFAQGGVSGEAPASDAAQEKEGRIGAVDGAPEAVTESDIAQTEVDPEASEVNDRVEPSENAPSEIRKSTEQVDVGKFPKDTELPTAEVAGKQTPPVTFEFSKEIPEGASEWTVPEPAERSAGSTDDTFNEAKPEEETSLPVQADAVEEKETGRSADDSPKDTGLPASEVEERQIPSFLSEMPRGIPEGASEESLSKLAERSAGSTEENSKEAKPEEEISLPVQADAVEGKEAGRFVDGSPKDTGLPAAEVEERQLPPFVSEVSRGNPEGAPEETLPELAERRAESREETSNEAKSEEGASLPVKEDDVVEENGGGQNGSGLEKQPSLSVYIAKHERADADAAPQMDTEATTPRGTPLLQRVEQLELKLAQLQGRQSPRSEFTSTGQSTPRSSTDRPIRHSVLQVLEETGSKGTLLDRVAALEQKLTYFLNVHLDSPSNGQSTLPVMAAAEELITEPDAKVAETKLRDWSPSTAAEGDEIPEEVNEGTSKATQDPANTTTKEKSPEDLPAHREGVAPARSSSIKETGVKAKAAAGKLRGLFKGCFTQGKKEKPVATST